MIHDLKSLQQELAANLRVELGNIDGCVVAIEPSERIDGIDYEANLVQVVSPIYLEPKSEVPTSNALRRSVTDSAIVNVINQVLEHVTADGRHRSTGGAGDVGCLIVEAVLLLTEKEHEGEPVYRFQALVTAKRLLSAETRYFAQNEPDATAVLDSGSEVRPLITLKNVWGGVAHIIEDDHCCVLILQHVSGYEGDAEACAMVPHWFDEAICALQEYRSKPKHNYDTYHVNKYWIYDDPASWHDIRVGELFMVRGTPYGHPELRGVVYRKCDRSGGQDSSGNFTAFDPRGEYCTLQPKKSVSEDSSVSLEHVKKKISAALCDTTPVSNQCTAPMTIKVFGDDVDELIGEIKKKIRESGIEQGLPGKVTVETNHCPDVDKALFAYVAFTVLPEDSIRNRADPWVELLDHRSGFGSSDLINHSIKVLRLDAPGAGGACHDYVLLAGFHEKQQQSVESKELTWRDVQTSSYRIYQNPRMIISAHHPLVGDVSYEAVGYDQQGQVQKVIQADFASVIRFQKGSTSQHGANGVTHEALLAILIDRLRGFQRGPSACPENAAALSKFEEALIWLRARGERKCAARGKKKNTGSR